MINTLLQVSVFIFEILVVLIQILYIVVMWTFWTLRYPFKYMYLKLAGGQRWN